MLLLYMYLPIFKKSYNFYERNINELFIRFITIKLVFFYFSKLKYD